MTKRHGRAVIGLVLMLLGVTAYGTVLLHIAAPPETCVATWLQLVRQYGFPAMLMVGGYNLFQKDALSEIALAWRARKV